MRRQKVEDCKELAHKAGQWISFDPDRYGEGLLDSMEAELEVFLGKLPEDVRDDYEDKVIAKYKEWMGALSRCFSQAITGAGGWKPATFRRHEKTMNAERNARKRLDEWKEKIIRRCNRQERLTGWAEVERLQAKLEELTDLQEKMKAANKIIRSKKLSEVEKVDELMAIGLSEATSIRCLEPDFVGRIGFPQYALSNNLAKIKDTEAKMKRHERMASQEDEIHRHSWGELHVDYSDERYRFLFNEKPSQEVICKMKEHGYKWSPANKAWQRQITPNAAYSTKKLLEELEQIFAEEEK